MQYSLNFNSNLSGFWVYVRDAGGKVTFLLAVAAAMSVDLAANFAILIISDQEGASVCMRFEVCLLYIRRLQLHSKLT